MKREGPAEFGDPMNGSCEYSTPKKWFKQSLACTNKCVFANKAVLLIWGLQKTTSSCSIRVGTRIIRKTQTVKRDPRWFKGIKWYKNLSGTKAQVIDQVMSPGRSCLQSRAHQTRCLQGALHIVAPMKSWSRTKPDPGAISSIRYDMLRSPITPIRTKKDSLRICQKGPDFSFHKQSTWKKCWCELKLSWGSPGFDVTVDCTVFWRIKDTASNKFRNMIFEGKKLHIAHLSDLNTRNHTSSTITWAFRHDIESFWFLQ